MFKGRNLVIATKHEKEKVIAPILEKELGVKCFVSSDLDTDKLGTFTGEVERKENPITTARNKCLMAMELTNCDLAIASEGSFGPAPNIYFIHSNEEVLLLIDKKNNLEIVARELSYDTNFNGSTINTVKHLKEFSLAAKFPSHGLIIKNSQHNFTEVQKGITNWDDLLKTYQRFIKTYGECYVETDMRAMFNPTRMKAIEKTTFKLLDKINSYCPNCNFPGFDITEIQKGLPCALCSMPTRSTFKHIYNCNKCNHSRIVIFPNHVTTEDPMYCDFCNP
jgi:hypothetical protein